MHKNIKNIIENEIEMDDSSVWVLAGNKIFPYTEGPSSENYLKKVFSAANDVTSDSYELEGWIKDWPSEYHLSRKRSQLLRGFHFDPSKKVLEVGCGCGAITRFLGETFDSVVAVEGSLTRAGIARMRTRDLDNVSVLCAPFQTVKFKERFDIIFCIGVFEYSNMFVDSPDPFNFILRYFRDMLTPDGVVFIAIENQFGLKYFSSSREDHTDIMFDGLEGYPRYGKKERTFGYHELKDLLTAYFNAIDFYFPYPDYKTPSCVLSERCFHQVKAGELVGSFHSSRYMNGPKPLFDERLVLLELEKNGMLPFFSNSFLVVAARQDFVPVTSGCLGHMYSNNRVECFQTVSRIAEHEDGGVYVDKRPVRGDRVESGPITLHGVRSPWVNELSIHAQIMKRGKDKNITLEEMFSPCLTWLSALRSLSVYQDGRFLLDGTYLDCILSNSFISGQTCNFIDREYEWHEKVNLNALLIRSLYALLNDLSTMKDLKLQLTMKSKGFLIRKVAKVLGIRLGVKDFIDFIELECGISHAAYGNSLTRSRFYVLLILADERILSFLLFHQRLFSSAFRKVKNLLLRFQSSAVL
jgi:2-polyprenyl-3-methyl-5-hydroxy-6-metoxy-1,4-benzoquinol methylase